MTYNEAVAVLAARYNAGEREMEVSPEVYRGYMGGLQVLLRTGGRPNHDREYLAFKAARIYESI